ncbi:hypothetical protein [Streptomyces sp. NPDC088725]|uniref:hypothetical protein n=1 Tax=Streptomyces sp. NPDC088725 TaxID=3365873 RepID=UPI0038183D7F
MLGDGEELLCPGLGVIEGAAPAAVADAAAAPAGRAWAVEPELSPPLPAQRARPAISAPTTTAEDKTAGFDRVRRFVGGPVSSVLLFSAEAEAEAEAGVVAEAGVAEAEAEAAVAAAAVAGLPGRAAVASFGPDSGAGGAAFCPVTGLFGVPPLLCQGSG